MKKYAIIHRDKGRLLVRYEKIESGGIYHIILKKFYILKNENTNVIDMGNSFRMKWSSEDEKFYRLNAFRNTTSLLEFEDDEAAKLYFEVME